MWLLLKVAGAWLLVSIVVAPVVMWIIHLGRGNEQRRRDANLDR